jgi:hypothetical protein
MKITWRNLALFAVASDAYLKQHPEETRLQYAINRVLPRITKLNDQLQEALTEIDIDHCATEKRGDDEVIIRDAQGLHFTKEAMKRRNRERAKLFDSEVAGFEPYFASKIPNLSEHELDTFAGIVIKHEDVERIHRERESEADTTQLRAAS